MARVVIENLYKVFAGAKREEVCAVNNVNLVVEDKEFLVLVGPSGCGKSTTLRMIAGLEEISRGTISIGGRVVNDLPPKDRDIAMVFQNYALYPHMTVYENMAFGLKLRKFPKPKIEELVKEAADILGLGPLLQRKPKALSGGQRQRVAVGRAIVRKPKVFLFDEPLSNLDAQMRVQMRAEISKLHRRLEATMIYVTHDQTEAMTMGDRIVVMKDGLIQQVADPMTVYHQPANLFVAAFIGSPPMNLFRGRLMAREGGLWFVDSNSPGTFAGSGLGLLLPEEKEAALKTFAGEEVVMGLRPEHISLAPRLPTAGRDLAATVEVVEPMGAEIHLHLRSGEHLFVARVAGSERPHVGEVVQVNLDLPKARFFDAATEQAMTGSAG